jgi:hypothetical protein
MLSDHKQTDEPSEWDETYAGIICAKLHADDAVNFRAVQSYMMVQSPA